MIDEFSFFESTNYNASFDFQILLAIQTSELFIFVIISFDTAFVTSYI